MKKFEHYYPEGWEWRPARGKRKSLVRGIGINDAPYAVQILVNGRSLFCPAYLKWKSMLTRVRCPKFHAKCPSYVGTEVCNQWVKLMVFREWLLTELVKTSMTAGEANLDKDLLADSKLYSPETCLLVPGWLNKLTTDSGQSRGELPIGVTRRNKCFRAQVNLGTGNVYLGTFPTVEEATACYKRVKLDRIKTIELPKWLPQRKLRKRLIQIVENQV